MEQPTRYLVPREPSVAGIVFTGLAASIALAEPSPSPVHAALAALLAYLHAASLSASITLLRLGRRKAIAVLAAANTAPYAASLAAGLWGPWLPWIAVAALAGALAAAALGPRSPYAYAAGSITVAAAGLAPLQAMGYGGTGLLLLSYGYTAYVAAASLYIESRMPHRSVRPWIPLALWLALAAPMLAAEPATAVAVAEPTAKKALAALRPSRVPPEKVKRLGAVEAARLVLYTALLTSLLRLTP